MTSPTVLIITPLYSDGRLALMVRHASISDDNLNRYAAKTAEPFIICGDMAMFMSENLRLTLPPMLQGTLQKNSTGKTRSYTVENPNSDHPHADPDSDIPPCGTSRQSF